MRNRVLSLGRHVLLSFVAVTLAVGCGTGKAHIRPAKQVQRDFYTCKGFKSGLPVGATSEFSLTDGLVYVVADLEKEQVGNRLDFEVASPMGKIAYFESVKYEQDRPYGIYFDLQKLAERGGPGRWKVLFWADGQPVGRLFFNLEGPRGVDEAWERAGASSGTIFDRLFGEEARPMEAPAITGEAVKEEAPALIETPEGVSFTPGEELITPESKSSIVLEKEPKEAEQSKENESP